MQVGLSCHYLQLALVELPLGRLRAADGGLARFLGRPRRGGELVGLAAQRDLKLRPLRLRAPA